MIAAIDHLGTRYPGTELWAAGFPFGARNGTAQERIPFVLEDDLARAQLDTLLDLVELHRVLGGRRASSPEPNMTAS